MSIDSEIAVGGALLQYRLSGLPAPAPVIVFENGWGASYENWAWVERELAPFARLLFYNRGGIGGSTVEKTQTASAISGQLKALLAALGIAEPVVLVGQSYGGLMCALHAAQQPQMVRALIELDPTPDQNVPAIDKQLEMVRPVARLAMLCARLGVRDPLFSTIGKLLPQPEGEVMVKRSFGSVASLRGALHELDLLKEIRAAIAAAPIAQPHLVISADRASGEDSGWFAKLWVSPEKAGVMKNMMQTLHRAKVAGKPAGEWQTLPFDHGSIIFEQAGAKASAGKIREFIDNLPK